MKAKYYPIKFVISLLILVALIGIAFGVYRDSFKQEASDPFAIELNAAAGLADRDITTIVNRYIPAGTSLSEAIEFFEVRGFRVYKTQPSDWHELKNDGKDRYVAYKEDKRNVVILTTARIILASDGERILSVYGKIHLTGL